MVLVEVMGFWKGVGGLIIYVSMPCRLWSTILKGCEEFRAFMSFRVGDGRRVGFGGHRWCGSLNITLPNLYRISCQRETTVQQV